MQPLLDAKGLEKSYPAIRVLKGVDLQVDAGETLAVIGPNGAGKTTLFKVLTGEVPLDAGSVLFEGRDVSRLPAFHRARLGFGRTFQVARVFSELTAFENVVIAVEAAWSVERGRGLRLSWRPSKDVVARVHACLDDVGLDEKSDTLASALSHGDKKRLELACCIALEPRILMLDEPTAGMSPSDRTAATELISRLKTEHGLSIMLTEHDMGVVFGIADRILVLNYGEVIAGGTVEEVRQNERVREIYLGSGHAHA